MLKVVRCGAEPGDSAETSFLLQRSLMGWEGGEERMKKRRKKSTLLLFYFNSAIIHRVSIHV